MKRHLWQGQWIDDAELVARWPGLPATLQTQAQLPLSTVIAACERFAREPDLDPEIAAFCSREALTAKVRHELGTTDCNDFVRIAYDRDLFEAWLPLGVLMHVTTDPPPRLPFLAMVEGLLAGNVSVNINVLKPGSSDSDFTLKALHRLGECDPSGVLNGFIFAFAIPASDPDRLKALFALADGISVSGGPTAIAEVRELSPLDIRLIPWVPKRSFSLVAREKLADADAARALAQDAISLFEQAGSSSHVVYVETGSFEELERFAGRVGKELETLEDPRRDWRLLLAGDPNLRPAPSHRTLWFKPASVDSLPALLAPSRRELQSAAIAASPARWPDLAQLLARAGVTRLLPLGRRRSSYPGEPQDGQYALPRFMKRISCEAPGTTGVSRFSDWDPDVVAPPSGPKVLDKASFQSQPTVESKSQLFFKSGGSTGKPVLSAFSYCDYNRHMQLAAEGLYAAGFDPVHDRAANLLFGGGLYGSFLGVFTILEHLGAVQFPFAAHMELQAVGEAIVDNRVNVLLGMPSYLSLLLQANRELFKEKGQLRKIFFGGEPFNPEQRRWLREEFGIELIKSSTYGSTDVGPMGFQCPSCQGGVHHLNHKLQSLEILKVDRDAPVEGDEVGRLVFTTREREAVEVVRYDLGDLGRWVSGPCACQRRTPRFELLGRLGDVFRTAGIFLNYQELERILVGAGSYKGELQVLLHKEGMLDRLELRLARGAMAESGDPRRWLLESYPDLREVVEGEGSLGFSITWAPPEEFLRTPGSGKLRRVVDLR